MENSFVRIEIINSEINYVKNDKGFITAVNPYVNTKIEFKGEPEEILGALLVAVDELKAMVKAGVEAKNILTRA